MISKFVPGRGVFTCVSCKKKTRATQGWNDEQCPKCIEAGEHQNSITDNKPKTHMELFNTQENKCDICKRIKQLGW